MTAISNPTFFPYALGAAAAGGAALLWALGRSSDEEEDSFTPPQRYSEPQLLRNPGPVVQPPLPLERRRLPNSCDPLQPPPRGYVCIAAGDRYVVVRPDHQRKVAVPGPTQVTFSEDYSRYKAGAAWDRGVLERGIEEVTTGTSGEWQWAQLEAFGWSPLVRVAFDKIAAALPPEDYARATAQVRQFATEHVVHHPGGPVRILDLPQTNAVTHLLQRIARAVATRAIQGEPS